MRGTTVIRPAALTDLPGVAAINGHYVANSVATFEQTPPDDAAWRARLDEITERGLPFLVAADGADIVGYGYCTPWRTRQAYQYTVENTVYVAPGATGRGIGRAVLAGLLDRCAEAGVREVIAVITDSGDPASLSLHRRCGFTEAGRLTGVGHKHGRWLDTVLLQYSVSSPAGSDPAGPQGTR